MAPPDYLVGFALDGLRFALPLASVERVVHAVAITPLPKAPEVILGVINVQGRLVPVADIRKRFRLPARDIALGAHIVIARTPSRPLALVADVVHGVMTWSGEDNASLEQLVPGLEYVRGIVKTPDGLVLIHDLDRFLALDEEASLQRAMADA
ncbi:MAG: chemotaxis protein CheW [Polaromonas sp.]